MKFFGRLKIIFDVRPILFDVQTKIGREREMKKGVENQLGTLIVVCISVELLTLDSSYTWENLTLDSLE